MTPKVHSGTESASRAPAAGEKNLRGGQRLSAPVGAALLAWAALIVVAG